MTPVHLVEQIAQLVGVADRHQDHTGRIVETPLESKTAVFEGLGLPVGSESEAIESLARVQAIRNRVLPSVVAIRSGQPTMLTLREVTADVVLWHITEETGETREGPYRAPPRSGWRPPRPAGAADRVPPTACHDRVAVDRDHLDRCAAPLFPTRRPAG